MSNKLLTRVKRLKEEILPTVFNLLEFAPLKSMFSTPYLRINKWVDHEVQNVCSSVSFSRWYSLPCWNRQHFWMKCWFCCVHYSPLNPPPHHPPTLPQSPKWKIAVALYNGRKILHLMKLFKFVYDVKFVLQNTAP